MTGQATERKSPYQNRAQIRVLQAQIVLSGHEAEGISPSAFARALGISQSLATRDLWNLSEAGFAEQLENGNWRLGPKAVQIAIAFQRGLTRLQELHSELTNRYTKEPR